MFHFFKGAVARIYSDKILHAGVQGYGLLWTGFGVGALIGALFTSFVAARVRPGLNQLLIALLWGGFLCPLMIFHSLPLALLCLALVPLISKVTILVGVAVTGQLLGMIASLRALVSSTDGTVRAGVVKALEIVERNA